MNCIIRFRRLHICTFSSTHLWNAMKWNELSFHIRNRVFHNFFRSILRMFICDRLWCQLQKLKLTIQCNWFILITYIHISFEIIISSISIKQMNPREKSLLITIVIKNSESKHTQDTPDIIKLVIDVIIRNWKKNFMKNVYSND